MFGLGKKKKEEVVTSINIEKLPTKVKNKEREIYIREALQNKKLPIVVLDPMWHTIKEQVLSSTIKENEEELNTLLKEQGQVNNDIKEYTLVKQNLLKEVLVISEEINDKGETHKEKYLETLHDSILKTNEKLEVLNERIDEVKNEIQKVNFLLVEETVAIGYEHMEIYKTKKIELEQEIDKLREQVVVKTEEKKQYDEKFTTLYNYMHKVVGYQYIDKVDKKIWSKEK